MLPVIQDLVQHTRSDSRRQGPLRQEVLVLFVDAASFEGTSVHFVPAAETCAHASAQTAVNIVMVRGCQFAV